MKKIDKEELFNHLSVFLKSKGVELRDGAYTKQIRHGCGILADTVNLSQQALSQAKTAVGTRLDQVRQVIHEKTAPRSPSPKPPPAPASSPEKGAEATAVHKPTSPRPKKARAKRKS